MNTEIWRKSPHSEYYEVSNHGRVRSLDRYDSVGRKRYGQVLKPLRASDGYLCIQMWEDGVLKHHSSVHRLVAMCFLDDFDPELQVHHIDHNKDNNHVSNLMMVTSRENMRAASDAGQVGGFFGRIGRRKLNEDKVRTIRSQLRSGATVVQLAKDYGVSRSAISHIKQNRVWRNV